MRENAGTNAANCVVPTQYGVLRLRAEPPNYGLSSPKRIVCVTIHERGRLKSSGATDLEIVPSVIR